MAILSPHLGGVASFGIVRRAMVLAPMLVFGLLFPTLVLWGGSTNLINWGPGLLCAGAACLLLLGKDRTRLGDGALHTGCFLGVIVLLLVRARYSADVSAAANSSALIGLAAAGFLIGKLINETKSRALLAGLSLVSIINFACSVIQINHPEWNLIYPQRSAGLPSGLFAHYSYSAAFCLGSAGLLASGGLKERAWLKAMMIGGAICALVTIPISLSRGGNLALAFIMAAAISLLLARAFSKSKSILSTWLPAIILLVLILIFAGSLIPLIGRNKGPGGFYADSARMDFWNAATRITADHPWLGGGPGSFSWEVFHVMDGLTLEPGMVHNEALQLAVEYGYPALLFIIVLITAPVAICLWRYVNKTSAPNSAWAALGMVAMLIQSNFESIFHASPGVFVAALILGQISRSLWGMEKPSIPATDQVHPEFSFLSAIKSHIDDYLAGSADALSKLVGLLLQSKDEQRLKDAYDLLYWEKTHDEKALRQSVMHLGTRFSEEIANLPSFQRLHKDPSKSSAFPPWVLTNFTLAACALPLLMYGTALSQALINAWVPLYHPRQITISQRFDQLLNLVEKRSGLGIDRMVLTAARDCIYHYQKQEDRENWATAHRTRIIRAIPGWKTDPGAALQLAEIVGWAGDYQSAIDFYDHAIASQGGNELLFMGHSFKGQYLYELSLSAGAAGNVSQQQFFARKAVDSFKSASAALGAHQRQLDPYFGKMLNACEAYGRKDM